MVGFAILPARNDTQLPIVQQYIEGTLPELPAELEGHKAWIEEFARPSGDVWRALELSFVAMIQDNSPYPFDNLEIPELLVQLAHIGSHL